MLMVQCRFTGILEGLSRLWWSWTSSATMVPQMWWPRFGQGPHQHANQSASRSALLNVSWLRHLQTTFTLNFWCVKFDLQRQQLPEVLTPCMSFFANLSSKALARNSDGHNPVSLAIAASYAGGPYGPDLAVVPVRRLPATS